MDATPTLAEICTIFGCAHVDALDALYLKHDQELMYNFQWDYQDDALLTNRIRTKTSPKPQQTLRAYRPQINRSTINKGAIVFSEQQSPIVCVSNNFHANISF